jgi:hypothetical protein
MFKELDDELNKQYPAAIESFTEAIKKIPPSLSVTGEVSGTEVSLDYKPSSGFNVTYRNRRSQVHLAGQYEVILAARLLPALMDDLRFRATHQLQTLRPK